MNKVDYYENVRSKLRLGPVFAPKHKIVYDLMKLFWNDEEIKILSYFRSADKYTSLKRLSEKSGLSRKEIKEILARSVKIGTISRIGKNYSLKPLLPGIYETYFIRRRDSKENQIKAANLFRDYINELFPLQMIESDFRLFRPLLPYKANEKLIDVDQSLNVQSQVLPFELVEILIDKNDLFVTIPCQCRFVGEIDGDPCKVATSDLGCLYGGIAAQEMINMGVGKQLTKKEAIEHIKKAEKAGLVHNTMADTGILSSIYICNCCSCHCGILSPSKKYHMKTVNPSNYIPKIDNKKCKKCEICQTKCPMNVIYHQRPNNIDSSDDHMFIRYEFCIGCGVCASNCPNDAIKMVKVRNAPFSEEVKLGNKPFLELFI